MTVWAIKNALEKMEDRSKWNRAVTEYALELIDDFLNMDYKELTKEKLLNGASDWNEYSWGGCSLIYDCDIAERVCTPSEFKKSHGGAWRPNKNEEWLDVQARALFQACNRIMRIKKSLEVAKHD